MTLFDPFDLFSKRLANRVVMAPMTRSRADREGTPLPFVADYYAQRSGAGLIVTEGVQPSPMGQGYPMTPGVHDKAQIAAWAGVVERVHAAGGVIAMQIMHVGRIAHPLNRTIAEPPVGASDAPAAGHMHTPEGRFPFAAPRALATAEIAGVVEEFARAAANAFAAGFDGVELHAANGYLPAQFLSPETNRRTDAYGGDAPARARFVIECLEAMIAAAGGEAGRVGIRISPGVAMNDLRDPDPLASHAPVLAVAGALKLAYVHVQRAFSPDLVGLPGVDTVAYARAGFKGPVIAAGGYDRAEAEATLAAGTADLIAFGRPFIANPDLAERLRRDLPLAAPDGAKIYAPGPEGYSDYPRFEDA